MERPGPSSADIERAKNMSVRGVTTLAAVWATASAAESKRAENPAAVEIFPAAMRIPAKTGINPDSMISLAEQISLLDSIRIKGLMGMPPLDADPRPYFDKLYKLWQSLPIDNRVFLSMGMTQDYETAIHCGSNMVRIGTAIFGKRNFS